jgi:hypothetical protein
MKGSRAAGDSTATTVRAFDHAKRVVSVGTGPALSRGVMGQLARISEVMSSQSYTTSSRNSRPDRLLAAGWKLKSLVFDHISSKVE